ncbi:MAG: hypothetical protein HKN91_07810 [Acidimicrobiia bacterium]|nr:hypothetical protein [Acidimicrobiia bacterium]
MEQLRVELATRNVSASVLEGAFSAARDDDAPLETNRGRRSLRAVPFIESLTASAAWTVVMWQSVIGNTSCIQAYNYRNNSTDYFRASSNTVNSDICYRVRATLWAAPHVTGGPCQAPWKASSSATVSYASKSKTYAPALAAPNNYVCSNHDAWTYDWMQVLAQAGHDAKISG